MAEVKISPAKSEDIPELIKLDHWCETTHVWQLEKAFGNGQLEVHFKEIKLPRSLKIAYPRLITALTETWADHTLCLVARSEEKIAGYLTIDEQSDQKMATVKDLVVDTPSRRQGIASALVIACQAWVKKRGNTRFVMEIPAKNHPAIQFANHLRFEFSGFNESFYSNRETALYFVSELK